MRHLPWLLFVALTACAGGHAPDQPMKPPTNPPVEPGVAPESSPVPIVVPDAPQAGSLGASPWLAGARWVEVEPANQPRRMTDDAGVVEATTAALRGATWTEAGMPRCLPQRWIRLVPASGEDGITALFCQADDPAYAHVPGGVSYSLDESSSRALYAAVTPVLSAREGSVAPVDVTTNLALLVVTVGRGERRVVLASTAKGDQIPLSPAQAGQVVNALMNAGFFPRAARYHRQLGQWLAAPPPLSKPEPDTLSTPAEGWVTVQVITPQLVRTWHETLGGAVFDHTLSTLLRAEDLGNGRAALETLQR